MYLATHEGEPPTGDLHPHTHAHAGRTQRRARDRRPRAVWTERERPRWGGGPRRVALGAELDQREDKRSWSKQNLSIALLIIMKPAIMSEVVVAYAQCPRKAYLLLRSSDKGTPHEYVRILEQQRCEHQARYLDLLKQKHTDVKPYTAESLCNGNEVLFAARLQADGFAAECDVLTRVEEPPTGGTYRYEPTLCVETYSISKEQKLALSFAGYVLGRLQSEPPIAGRLIAMDGTSHTINLDKSVQSLMPLLEPLRAWTTDVPSNPPPIVLNKHCPLCPFQRSCQAQAEQEENLSLLNGITARTMRQYAKKGIFTVTQLSYLFRPRKRKTRSRNRPRVTHKVELQALAIRTNKIYLQNLPELSRQPIELFLDIEGVPDRQLHYLIGLLVCQADTTTHSAFWADTDHDERQMWQQFLDKVTQYPNAPIYHYGSYEPRALLTLAKRYQTESEHVTKRLVNVNSSIYGKMYFPVRSNGLKDIGHFIGAKWTSPQASGLQSLVWRHHWEKTREETFKDLLLTYNAEDCQALQLLTNELSKIQGLADTLSQVDFANQPKRYTTEASEQIHNQLDVVLQFAHSNYDRKKIKFSQQEKRGENDESQGKKTFGDKTGYQGQRKVRPRPTKVVQVPHDTCCATCGHAPLRPTAKVSKRLLIDLVLTKNGVKKTITEYIGTQGYCPKCDKYRIPTSFRKYGVRQLYGHRVKAWVAYHRVALRMPYGSIAELLAEQFHEEEPKHYISTMMKDMGTYYAETEKSMTQHLLESPFIHVDETPMNIRGITQYAWVFTDGKYVVFKLTATREATMVHEFLKNYHGILVADFYPAYDAVQCRQQKCWVHLIRDLNTDLWAAPFDTELETFVAAVRDLIIPIMQAIQRYGLQKRHLQHFRKSVDHFYHHVILHQPYVSEYVLTYQKRFIRYRESLFTFLEHDGVPWHNNTAENAIRHLAIQRDTSPSLYESGTSHYLVLLGIRQTCRSQGKSFFRFLFSGETDLDQFEAHKRKR
jgi:predicted RecB family nuclease